MDKKIMCCQILLLISAISLWTQDYDDYLAKSRKLMMYQNDSAFHFIDKAIEVAPNYNKKIEAKLVKANLYINISMDSKQAIENLNEINQNEGTKLSSILKARLYEGLCSAYGNQAEYKRLLESAHKMLEHAEHADFKNAYPFVINAYNFLGDGYFNTKDYQVSTEYYTKSFDLAVEMNQIFGIHQSAYYLFSNYKDFLDEEPYASYLFKYLEITNPMTEDGIHGALGFLDKYKLTAAQYESLWMKAKHEGELNAQIRMATKLSEVLINDGLPKTALPILDEVIQNIHSINQTKALPYALDLKYEALKKMGDYDRALNTLDLYHSLKDSLADIELNKYADSLNIVYETSQKNQQIAEQQMHILKSQRQRNGLITGILGLLMLSGFVLFMMRKRHAYLVAIAEKEKELQLEKVQKLEQEQKILALDYMLLGEENERKRVAKDLHDSLGALLTSAKLQIQKIHQDISYDQDDNLFGQAEQIIENAAEEVRRISHDMMPEALMNLGLQAAIEDLVSSINASDQLNASIQFFDMDESVFSDQVKVNVYRIVQELCQNVIKHARASHMIVQLSQDGSELLLEVEDDGVGFDSNNLESNEGIGLRNIESRVKYLNGRMDIDTMIGGPSIFRITVPLNV